MSCLARFLVASAAIVAMVVPASVSSSETDSPFWKERGCTHPDKSPPWHRSVVARNRIRSIMQNHTPFTKAEGRQVRHYTYCVTTRAKARAGVRLVRNLKGWRRRNVCTAARGNRELGRCMAARDKGWTGGQWSCLDALWSHESGWNQYQYNLGGSGAYGIPQALPGSKMASHGPDWQSNPATQIAWGLDYIAGRYGTPCGALYSLRTRNWY